MLRHLPKEIEDLVIHCPSCKKRTIPDWLTKLEFPVGGVETKKGEWVRGSFHFKCSNEFCDSNLEFTLPRRKMVTEFHLFGDEAYRQFDIGEKLLYTFSVVGCDKSFLPEMEGKVRKMKIKLAPDIEPKDWTIHMKEIWSGQKRKKHKVFHSWDKNKLDLFREEISKLFNDHRLFKYNTILLTGNKDLQKENFVNFSRNESFKYLIGHTAQIITDNGAKPVYFFDSQTAQSKQNNSPGWAEKEFENITHTKLFSYLAKGRYVRKPSFIKPGSRPLSELADILSFYVARYHFCNFKSRKIDVNLKDLGKVVYSSFKMNTGDFIYKEENHYPWEFFFPIEKG